jgi:hypothetical protein
MTRGSKVNWQALAAQLYPAAKSAGCRCEYERNGAGVPVWYPAEGGLERRLIQRCSRCVAILAYEAAVIT